MKKLVWVSILVAVISFVVWSNDPLNDAANFIIAGSIPGTSISIGFWSTLALASLLLWITYRGFKSQQHKIMEQQTKQNKTESAKKEFEDTHKVEFDRSQRSVIAARSETSL